MKHDKSVILIIERYLDDWLKMSALEILWICIHAAFTNTQNQLTAFHPIKHSRSNCDFCFQTENKPFHVSWVFFFLVFEVTKVQSQNLPALLNASHCQFIPPPSFSSLLYPPPITHPFSSLLARPIPQTNQFACLSSILFPMPAPTLSFVLYCNLQFQRPSINLNFTLPSFTPPHTPFPLPHILLKENIDSATPTDWNAVSFRKPMFKCE